MVITKPDKLLVSDPAQLKELSSPVKQIIIDALKRIQEPCSIKEVAERINRAPDSLYYHFRSLVKVGLILEAGKRIESGKPVALYLPAAKSIKIRYDFSIPGFRSLICKIFRAAVRLATRDFERGVDLPHVRGDTLTRNLYMCRMEAWLSESALCEINRRMDEIVDIMNENSSPKSGERCAVLMALTPHQTNAPD